MIGDYGLNKKPNYRGMAKMTQEADRRVLHRGYPLYLPDDKTLERFKAEFPEKTNDELTEITHRSGGYNSRLGSYLGLQKSEAFKERRKNMAIAKLRLNRTKGKPPKGVMPPPLRATAFNGTRPNRRPTPEEHGACMKKLWAEERMREKYGLQRKTKLRIK